jgi:hypothetical protein
LLDGLNPHHRAFIGRCRDKTRARVLRRRFDLLPQRFHLSAALANEANDDAVGLRLAHDLFDEPGLSNATG